MTTHLKDKVAIVTGSSSGLGEAIAIMFASRGAKVTLCGRDQHRLSSVFEKVVKVNGGKQDMVIIVQGDLKDQRVRKEAIDQTVEKFGRLDILVANAGIILQNQSVRDATEETFDDIMNTNLKSVFFLIQQAVPHLEKTKGNIITISSACTDMAVPSATISLLSKVALDHLTRCLAVDLGPKGIRVNTVRPAFIPTRAFRYVGDHLDKINSAIQKDEIDKQPLKGRIGTPDDIAEAVSFLVSDSAGFITGELVNVDGGRRFGVPISFSTL